MQIYERQELDGVSVEAEPKRAIRTAVLDALNSLNRDITYYRIANPFRSFPSPTFTCPT